MPLPPQLVRRFGVAAAVLAMLLGPAAGPGSGPAAAAPGEVAPAATLTLVLVKSGFNVPLFVTHAGDGRLFVVEQEGLIKVIHQGQVSTFLDLRAQVPDLYDYSDQGVLGLAFHPNYVRNRRFYVMYTANNVGASVGDNIIASFLRSRFHRNRADPRSGQVLVRIEDLAIHHNGGMLAFQGKYLYAGTGDGGTGLDDAGDPQGNGQNRAVRLGKILRLDMDKPPTWVPDSNPFVGVPNTDPLIWAYGLRVPWRFSFDRGAPDGDGRGDLYIGDVGHLDREEIDFQPSTSTGGENYGWSVLEGTQCFPSTTTSCPPPPSYVAPIYEYTHSEGCSVTGGYVYRGPSAPSLSGKYIFGDYCSGFIWSLAKTGPSTWSREQLFATDYRISSFGEDNDGDLYVVDRSGGAIYRLQEAEAASTSGRASGAEEAAPPNPTRARTKT